MFLNLSDARACTAGARPLCAISIVKREIFPRDAGRNVGCCEWHSDLKIPYLLHQLTVAVGERLSGADAQIFDVCNFQQFSVTEENCCADKGLHLFNQVT